MCLLYHSNYDFYSPDLINFGPKIIVRVFKATRHNIAYIISMSWDRDCVGLWQDYAANTAKPLSAIAKVS